MIDFNIKKSLSNNIIPLVFGVIVVLGLLFSEELPILIIKEVFELCLNNALLVLALLIPIMAGMGLNFSIAVGAMAGQIAVIFAVNWGLKGFPGFIVTALFATVIAIVFGYLTGKVLSKTKGHEMIVSLFLVYFANGLYQAILLSLPGRVIPFKEHLMIGNGVGLKKYD